MNIKKIMSITMILFSIVNIVLSINLLTEVKFGFINTRNIIILIIIQIMLIIIASIIYKNSKSKLKSNLLMLLAIVIIIKTYFMPVKYIETRAPLDLNIPEGLQCPGIKSQNLYNTDL